MPGHLRVSESSTDQIVSILVTFSKQVPVMMLTSLTTRKLFRLMVTYCKNPQLFSVSKVNTVNLVWLCMWGCGVGGGVLDSKKTNPQEISIICQRTMSTRCTFESCDTMKLWAIYNRLLSQMVFTVGDTK